MKTVGDLIKELSALDPKLTVALASDEEGNSINSWSGAITLSQYHDDGWGGDFSDWMPEDDDGHQDPVTTETADSIIIWP